MVMSIGETIASLEAEMAQLKGPGSKEKKATLQKKIDTLMKENKPTGDEKAKITVTSPKAVKMNTGIPAYKKVTLEQVKRAEAEGKLCGFDADAMTASIRD